MKSWALPCVLSALVAVSAASCDTAAKAPAPGRDAAAPPVAKPPEAPPAPHAAPVTPAEPVAAVEKGNGNAITAPASAPEVDAPAARVTEPPPPSRADGDGKGLVAITTEHGRIGIQLFFEDAPKHSENFVNLVRKGFYDGLTFHKVIEGSMVLGGDPEGTGKGGPGYTIPAEIQRTHVRGAVAAAGRPDFLNPEKVSNGSQFYICLQARPELDGQYTVFGQVVEGMDVVEKLRGVPASGQGGAAAERSGDKMLTVRVEH